ncbi:MFS transporter [Paenarthrobacter sp. DKR-5]|uniref:MFS transporter n=1 Tax=Paenarthrobacter sp. DKR-5 TaxID=2835535 RepID=UPI001BDBF4E5|nr:MFS transporter [Paenarthrobacter sp. DKR-5]MBT1002844.1 MFS transporter [Paenarthrobacter sp. DKR-5]
MTITGQALWEGHTKGSPAYRRILGALALAGVATFAQLYSPQGILPLVARDLSVTAAQAALSISVATLGLAAAVLPWSFAADRMGRVRAMATAVIAATVLGLLVPLAPDFGTLLVLRGLEGAALGGIPALAVAYLNEEVHRSHAVLAAGTYVAGTTIGGLSGRLIAGPVAQLAGWRAGTLAVSLCAAAAAAGFLLLTPRQLRFTPSALRPRAAFALLGLQLRRPVLLALYGQAFLLMGGFVAVYNYLGFRLEARPYLLPTSLVSLMFIAYLAGTVSSRRAAQLTARFGRRAVLLGGHATMAAGLLITLAGPLPLVLAGLVVLTAGFFAAHSIASGWTGAAADTGKAQAASLYNLAYYSGSSLLGWAAGFAFQAFGWTALALSVLGLTVLAALTARAVLPR